LGQKSAAGIVSENLIRNAVKCGAAADPRISKHFATQQSTQSKHCGLNIKYWWSGLFRAVTRRITAALTRTVTTAHTKILLKTVLD